MKIKVPPEIKIGVHTYNISLDRNLRADNDRLGEINHRAQTIKIWMDAPPSMKDVSLIHEVLHVAEYCYRVNIIDADVDRIAHCICEFLGNLGVEFDWRDIKEGG